MMKRREFITLLGSTAATWPLAALAQRAMPVIGFLSSASSSDYAPMIAEFRRGLGETGYVEGRDVKIEYVWADEQYDRLPTLAADLVRHQVAIIAAASTPAALAAKPATKTIPIVFAIGGDPVRTGLVDSLSRPGGNLTGATHINVETAPKRLELLHELMPAEKVIGLLVNPTNPVAKSVTTGVQAAAGSLALELQVVHARTDEDLDAVFASLHGMRIGGLVIGTDPFFTSRSTSFDPPPFVIPSARAISMGDRRTGPYSWRSASHSEAMMPNALSLRAKLVETRLSARFSQ